MTSRQTSIPSPRGGSHNYPPLQIRPERWQTSASSTPTTTSSTTPSPWSPPLSPSISTSQRNSRAVIIGINYFNQKGEMRGRVDEARNLYNYLQQCKGYLATDIILLTDDQNGTYSQPTRRNILAALTWLSEQAYPGEHLLLYYTGHGRINARGITEESRPGVIGCDSETIFPADFRQQGEISPSEFEAKLQVAQRQGARLTLIIDTHTAGFEKKNSVGSPNSNSSNSPASSSGRKSPATRKARKTRSPSKEIA